jgi:cysteinyl-tRNA synthetase
MGNAVALKDVLDLGYTAREIRYLLISTHYRQPVSYSAERLKAARAALKRIDAFVSRLQRCSGLGKSDSIGRLVEEMSISFEKAMETDLNVPMALGEVFVLIRRVNERLAKGEVSEKDAGLIMDALTKVHTVLGVFDFNPSGADAEDPEIEALVSKREEARERKQYEEADRIRDDLKKRNVVLEDTAYGTLYWIENPPPK